MFKFCPNCGTPNPRSPGNFKCKNCGKSFYKNSKPTTSVIPVYQNKEILMGLRAEDPHKGKFDYIGGFLENGEDPLDGAVREFQEETGYLLDKKDLEFLDISIGEYRFQDELIYTFNVCYLVRFNQKPKLEAKDDVAELRWLDINGEIDHAFAYQTKVLVRLREARA